MKAEVSFDTKRTGHFLSCLKSAIFWTMSQSQQRHPSSFYALNNASNLWTGAGIGRVPQSEVRTRYAIVVEKTNKTQNSSWHVKFRDEYLLRAENYLSLFTLLCGIFAKPLVAWVVCYFDFSTCVSQSPSRYIDASNGDQWWYPFLIYNIKMRLFLTISIDKF